MAYSGRALPESKTDNRSAGIREGISSSKEYQTLMALIAGRVNDDDTTSLADNLSEGFIAKAESNGFVLSSHCSEVHRDFDEGDVVRLEFRFVRKITRESLKALSGISSNTPE